MLEVQCVLAACCHKDRYSAVFCVLLDTPGACQVDAHDAAAQDKFEPPLPASQPCRCCSASICTPATQRQHQSDSGVILQPYGHVSDATCSCHNHCGCLLVRNIASFQPGAAQSPKQGASHCTTCHTPPANSNAVSALPQAVVPSLTSCIILW